jgi:hypothetical protein
MISPAREAIALLAGDFDATTEDRAMTATPKIPALAHNAHARATGKQ